MNINSLGLLDRNVGIFKQALYKLLKSENTKVWVDKIQGVADGVNDRVRSQTTGASANDLDDENDMLTLLLKKKNEKALNKNQEIEERRLRKFTVGSQFRVLIPQSTQRANRRSFKPKYGDKVHTVLRTLEGGRVEDLSGKIHKTRLLLHVGQANVRRRLPRRQ